MSPTAPENPEWILLPREHGAWGMLLLPFMAGTVLGGGPDGTVVVSLVALLLGFVIREPLAVLARQRWVWRVRRPEAETAIRMLVWQIPVLAVCGIYLWLRLPHGVLLLLGGAAAALTAIAVWMIVHNRARSVALQLVSAVGLSASALLAALAATGRLPVWAFQLWLMMSLHSAIGVLVVRTRLEHRLAKGAARRGPAGAASGLGAVGLAVVAAATWAFGYNVYPLPIAASSLFAAFELLRLRRLGDEPFTRVGLRMLFLSVIHAGLTVSALRTAATP